MNQGQFQRRAQVPAWRKMVPSALLLVLLGGGLPTAQATGLMETWEAAQTHDLDFMAAQAAYQAGQTQNEQAAALWRPNLQAQATAGRMSNDSQIQGAQFQAPGLGLNPITGANFNTSINNGLLDRWSISARQPLISGERQAQSRQLQDKARLAELQWQEAQQNLILQSTGRYFEVALAQATVQVLRQQELSIQRALDEARQRYQAGDAPITAVHEANARREAVRAQLLAADSDLQLKREAFADATGIDPALQRVFVPGAVDPKGEARSLEQWQEAVKSGNLQLRRQQLQVQLAREESQRYRAVASPALDLVGEMTRDHLAGNGEYGAAANNLHTAMVGLQLTVPLYSGGMRSARLEEASHLAEKVQDEASRGNQQMAMQTRAAWLELTTGNTRAEALAAAWRASVSRLAATRLGRQVGDRSTLDLLNAESDVASARLGWVQARIAVILSRLQLAALAGQLGPQQLESSELCLDRNVGNDDNNK